MMDEKTFQELVAKIERQGYDRATAESYAIAIGDTPVVDENELTLVMIDGKVAARLKLS